MESYINFSGFIGKDIKIKGRKGKVLGIMVTIGETTSKTNIMFFLQTSTERELGFRVDMIGVSVETILNGEISIVE